MLLSSPIILSLTHACRTSIKAYTITYERPIQPQMTLEPSISATQETPDALIPVMQVTSDLTTLPPTSTAIFDSDTLPATVAKTTAATGGCGILEFVN